MAITHFRIEDIKTLGGTTHLWVDVAFLDGAAVIHRNDFIMEILPTERRYTGPPLPPSVPGEKPTDPSLFTTTDTNVPAAILANIRAYVARANDSGRFALTDVRIPAIRGRAVDTDPLGLRARPGVSDLVGQIQMRRL